MNEEPEIGKVAADFIARNLENTFEFAKSMFTGVKAEIELQLKTAYTTYIEKSAAKFGRAKSFFIRSIPTDIYSFYVPMRVISGNMELPNVSINDIIGLTPRAVITASAGAGKSILLRHLFLDALRNSDRVPVFIELRSVYDSHQNLTVAIHQHMANFGFDLGDAYVEKAIERGHVTLLLDGFDEVRSEFRSSLSNQIINISQRAPDCAVIVSSRQDDLFSGWHEFREFSVAPLSMDEACDLVKKLPFDQELKEKFVTDLCASLYDKHESFLSNPLLLSIMLLTYGESADIPSKLSLFYNQAYEALFQRHDALKGGYQRDRRTSLDIQDFARVFSAFCLQTYDLRRFQFSRTDALDYIRKAKDYVAIDVDDGDYLEDCLQSVCLLMDDGLDVVFSHRSFQEYFVARHIQNADPLVQKELLARFIGSIRTDSIYALLYEMNPGLVERMLLVPKLNQIFDDIGVRRFIGVTHFTKFLKANFTHIRVSEGTVSFVQMGANLQDYRGVEVVAFAYNQCVAVQNRINFDERRKEAFIGRYSADGQFEYDLKKLSYNSPFIKELAMIGGFFSLDGMNSVLRLARELQRRHTRIRDSLDQLLT